MTRIFGDFSEDLPDTQEGLTIVFSPTSFPLKERWRNTGLSADFLADYFATFFPGSQEAITETFSKEELKSAVSFIANELLENAIKFNDASSLYSIIFRLQMHSDRLVFLCSNAVKNETIDYFQAYLKEITTLNTSDLYMRQLEKNGGAENHGYSGLGFLTMLEDYHAIIGWKFHKVLEKPYTIAVTTMVQLILKML